MRGRVLHFKILDSVPGVVDAGIYGRPVPFYHFVEVGQGKYPIVRTVSRSTWAYASQKFKWSKDTTAPIPGATRLPVYTTIPKAITFDHVDDEDDDGLSPCLNYRPIPIHTAAQREPASSTDRPSRNNELRSQGTAD